MLYRKVTESDVWLSRPYSRGQAWVDILLNTNYTDKNYEKRGINIPVKRGQCAISIKGWGARWGWSKGKVTRFLDRLVYWGNIEYQTDHVTTMINILNYDEYNPLPNKTGRKRAANGPQTGTTNKGDKGKKKEYTLEFEKWWGEYPRGRGSKTKSFDIWQRINPDTLLQERMLNTLRAHKQTEQWQTYDKIPHATTWLNEERWDMVADVKEVNPDLPGTKFGG